MTEETNALPADVMGETKTGEAAKPGRKPKPETVRVRVARDYWDENEERVSAGTIIEVPVATALKGVKSGALDTVD